jgi:hypothetical protein
MKIYAKVPGEGRGEGYPAAKLRKQPPAPALRSAHIGSSIASTVDYHKENDHRT